MSDITRILEHLSSDDSSQADQLLPMVYQELHRLATAKLARERPGQTLQATALVHEAYLRLVDNRATISWKGKAHFFGAAAEAMRRILIERARRHASVKHGGGWQRVDIEPAALSEDQKNLDILALDEALSEFEQVDPVKAQLVKLRIYSGLTIEETAEALEISVATVNRHWNFARAWLGKKLSDKSDSQLSDKSP